MAIACLLAGHGLVLGCPAPAHAWTNTQPASATAHVHLWPSGRALVSLTLDLDVRGGWVSEFEVAGLDPGSVLDPDKPPWVLCEDGRKAAPTAELRPDGTLVLSFAKGDAPRRGRHRLGIAYFTELARTDTASGARRLSFALPAWRVGLEHVDLWVNAPAPVRFLGREESSLDGASSRELLELGPRAVLHLHRAGLPRTLAFGVELELPAEAPARKKLAPVSSEPALKGTPLWLGLVTLGLAWSKRRAVAVRAARCSGAPPLALLRMGEATRSALMLALALGGALAYPRWPALGLALLAGCIALALHRHAGGADSARPRRGLERARELLDWPGWLDATTPLGLSLLGSAYTLAALRIASGAGLGPWLELLVLVTPLLVTGTRLHRAGAPIAMGPQPESTAPESQREAAAESVSRRAGADRRAPVRAA